jgi:chromosomal replication initiation ATPase DnaA
MRLLDKGLPRLDMRRTDSTDRWLSAKPVAEKRSRGARAGDMAQLLRALMRDARKDREEAATILADARAQAQTIIAEAEASACIVSNGGPALVRVVSIQRQTAERHGVTLQAMLGPGTGRHLVAARYEAIRLAHAARPDLSSAALGRLFKRDHTIILRALKQARGT